MDALRRSIANDDEKPTKAKAARSKKRTADQGEMLMPITGSGKGRAAAKASAKKSARRRKAS
jgi:DNA end-binding protein Ku